MNTFTRLAAVAFAVAAMASQVQAKTEDLGALTSSGTTFGNTFFTNVSDFTDYYTFSIADSGTVSGTTVDTSYILFFTKDVVLNSLTLTSGGSSSVIAKDTTANSFTFSGLAAGSYSLAVNGAVSGLFAGYGSYSGTIKAVSSPVASAAPEPADLALTLVGLAGVGYMVRRRAAR
ncbi:MAG: FxDxF family PEP-CTERM protein [Aquabacterium sp.]|uniref:FxDxF family PEP-CTERM protein n=1 Tax=Aquabacterium sp. TaxID=1872578 RepID=UPI0025BA1A84|nr:FxDxF family PEP-CTERM protein [Aquabacterium sp.]MBI3384158.1 FxDxF family PEP-CTERM protein [Aquabacterium sp.]